MQQLFSLRNARQRPGAEIGIKFLSQARCLIGQQIITKTARIAAAEILHILLRQEEMLRIQRLHIAFQELLIHLL